MASRVSRRPVVFIEHGPELGPIEYRRVVGIVARKEFAILFRDQQIAVGPSPLKGRQTDWTKRAWKLDCSHSFCGLPSVSGWSVINI